MATIVNLNRDVRAAELGQGVAGFLDNLKQKRLDKLQQELLTTLNGAQSEVEAAAFLADPKYQDLLGERLDNVLKLSSLTKPNVETVLVYDQDGNQVAVDLDTKAGETLPDFIKNNPEYSLEPQKVFAVTQPDTDVSIPIPGVFRTRQDAIDSLGENFDPETQQMLTQAEANARNEAIGLNERIKLAREKQKLDESIFKWQQEKPETRFSMLVKEYERGDLSDEQFAEAWARLTTILGRTQFDIPRKLQSDLLTQEADVRTLVRVGNEIIDKVIANPGAFTDVARFASWLENIEAELTQIGNYISLDPDAVTSKEGVTIEGHTYDEVLADLGFTEISQEVRNALLHFTVIFAAANGQSNRALSDKDFEIFRGIAGGNLKNPAAFINNMNELMRRSVDRFETMYGVINRESFKDSGKPPIIAVRDPKAQKKALTDALNTTYGTQLDLGGP